jgi:hypothetical protein
MREGEEEFHYRGYFTLLHWNQLCESYCEPYTADENILLEKRIYVRIPHHIERKLSSADASVSDGLMQLTD